MCKNGSVANKHHRVEYKRVQCPKVLTDITACARVDDDTFMAEAAKVANKPSAAAKMLDLKSSLLAFTVGTTLLASFNLLL